MNTTHLSIVVCFLASLSLQGLAGQTPKGLFTDNRIKIVSYDEDNVVHVNTTFGFATTIELQKGEYITENPGIGKGAGWEIASPDYSNFIVVKPKVENNTTNLNFTTNKGRNYTFLLTANTQSSRPTFRVRFLYSPLNMSGIGSRQPSYDLIHHFGNPDEINTSYSFWGDKTIAPVMAKDNGNFTLLRFKKGSPIPAILAVDLKSRRESLVNYRLQGNYVVIEGVYPQYTLRLGAHVTCLFNDLAIKEWRGGR
ncbi:TrbG/VirB9 family P-type conjugative transfer protein [Legionella feeleii]|uniref:Protein LvhB9 n=1 Tax=Legionella feeleii TaxID=453 RepID=A0A378IWJ4_9GAMM|nr:TrbG/VirB9 family P-type conjugative transfer protein [Legionella feeleii]STX39292.1 protein LvhB9 [Legionella feeleii]